MRLVEGILIVLLTMIAVSAFFFLGFFVIQLYIIKSYFWVGFIIFVTAFVALDVIEIHL